MYRRTNGLFHSTVLCSALDSLLYTQRQHPGSRPRSRSWTPGLRHRRARYAPSAQHHPPCSTMTPVQPGFACQGNEFSLFMLLVSSFILNKLLGPHPTFNSHLLTKTIERKPSTNTYSTPTSTLFLTCQKQARCFARSRYLMCCHRTSQLEQISLWLQVRLCARLFIV